MVANSPILRPRNDWRREQLPWSGRVRVVWSSKSTNGTGAVSFVGINFPMMVLANNPVLRLSNNKHRAQLTNLNFDLRGRGCGHPWVVQEQILWLQISVHHTFGLKSAHSSSWWMKRKERKSTFLTDHKISIEYRTGIFWLVAYIVILIRPAYANKGTWCPIFACTGSGCSIPIKAHPRLKVNRGFQLTH